MMCTDHHLLIKQQRQLIISDKLPLS